MDGFQHDYGLTVRSGASGPTPQLGSWPELARATGHQFDTTIEPDEMVGLVNDCPHVLLIGHRIYAAIKELVLEPTGDPAVCYERASKLIAGIRSDALGTALVSPTKLTDRLSVLHGAIAVVRPPAIRAIIISASTAYEKPASEVLIMMIKKIEERATLAHAADADHAIEAFRAFAHHLVDGWATGIVDTSATGYDHLFLVQKEVQSAARILPEPERIVQLGLEIGAVGPVLWEAVGQLTSEEKLRQLLGMLKRAPENSKSAQVIAQQFATPVRLSILLREAPVDFEGVDALLQHMGLTAADTLLNELITSNMRATRRGILERLSRLGPGIEPLVIERLKDERWFVLRNMLHVLNAANCPLERVQVTNYQTHTDPRVRREALQLLFKDPLARDRALASTFKDTDPATLRIALRAARTGLPDAAMPILAKRILQSDFPPEFRVPSIYLLGRSRSMLALETLLKFVSGGTTLLGKPKLATRSPEMIAALKGLARTWSGERRAKVLLDLATTSSDPQIAGAATSKGETPKEVDDEIVE